MKKTVKINLSIIILSAANTILLTMIIVFDSIILGRNEYIRSLSNHEAIQIGVYSKFIIINTLVFFLIIGATVAVNIIVHKLNEKKYSKNDVYVRLIVNAVVSFIPFVFPLFLFPILLSAI